jgi:hypothetical protein
VVTVTLVNGAKLSLNTSFALTIKVSAPTQNVRSFPPSFEMTNPFIGFEKFLVMFVDPENGSLAFLPACVTSDLGIGFPITGSMAHKILMISVIF